MTPAVQIFAINLLPVIGTIVFGWSALSLILIYWIENLIIGAINALKMLIAGGTAGWVGLLASLFLTAFFAVHYGFFCYAHGTMIWGLFGNGARRRASPSSTPSACGRRHGRRCRPTKCCYGPWPLLGAFHVYAFARYWLGTRRWETADPATQMFAPLSAHLRRACDDHARRSCRPGVRPARRRGGAARVAEDDPGNRPRPFPGRSRAKSRVPD